MSAQNNSTLRPGGSWARTHHNERLFDQEGDRVVAIDRRRAVLIVNPIGKGSCETHGKRLRI